MSESNRIWEATKEVAEGYMDGLAKLGKFGTKEKIRDYMDRLYDDLDALIDSEGSMRAAMWTVVCLEYCKRKLAVTEIAM